ncbi:hypothetical protein E4H12_03525 [Candidatus Thorarchaeota archaeon]|nr:MAG: hypothetical protein E4H12_03525 [Candidatus Thorarchaeota archaeon]
MEGSENTLVLSRGLTIVVIIGLAVLFTAPFIEVTPIYLIYHDNSYTMNNVVLDDIDPMFELGFPLESKVIIEGMNTTAPVDLYLYEYLFSDDPQVSLLNITDISDVHLVCTRAPEEPNPTIRIMRHTNETTHIDLAIRVWGGHLSTDNIVIGSSPLIVLAIPLFFMIYKYRKYRPDRRAYAMLLLCFISAALVSPFIVYSYNHQDSLLKEEVILDYHQYSFEVNESTQVYAFDGLLQTNESEIFVRVANISTKGIPVAMIFIPDNGASSLMLPNITTFSPSTLKIEFPKDADGFDLQLTRLSENTTIELSLETVLDRWYPYDDSQPPYVPGIAGLAIATIALLLPRKVPTQNLYLSESQQRYP